MALNGIANENGGFRFTEAKEGFNKLLLGEMAVVIALSSKNGQPYFAMQMVKLKEKLDVELALITTTWEEIEGSLSRFD
ncbi:MAG: hypothetical protein JKX84_07530 [Flavobacteriales bacterium]|nr:hypothetical protein [Flavobacteriales bacterium]